MTDGRRRVLEMLAEGKVSAEEADRLINALERPSTGVAVAEGASTRSTNPKYLRVLVDRDDPHEGPIKVNVRIPLTLLRAGVKLASLIPASAQDAVNDAMRQEGLMIDLKQIKPENLEEIIDQLRDLTVDVDKADEKTKIRIFCE